MYASIIIKDDNLIKIQVHRVKFKLVSEGKFIKNYLVINCKTQEFKKEYVPFFLLKSDVKEWLYRKN